MLNPFKHLKNQNNHAAPMQKIDRTVLMSAMDEVLDHAFGKSLFGSDIDELIDKTGKSRQEILSACLADDEVDACREDLESALIAREWRIYEDVAENSKPQVDVEMINHLYKVIKKHIREFARLAILAKFNGFAVAEYIYRFDDTVGLWVIDRIKSKEGELDKFIPKRDGSVIFNDTTRQITIDQQVKCLVLKSRAVPTRPMGEMMIVKAYPAVVLRAKGFAYAGQFIARYAQPFVVGKQGDSLFESAMSFTHKLYGFLSGGALGMGKDDDVSIHQLNGSGEAFELLERLCNRRIQKLLLGKVKISEMGHGSRAANETEDKVRNERIAGYLALMSEAVQHALDAMLAVNDHLGTPINAPQGLWFEYVSPTQVDKTRAERDKLYSDTGLIALTEDYFVDIVGLEKHHFKMVSAVNAGEKDSQNKDTHSKAKAGQDKDINHQDKDDLPLSVQLSDNKTGKHQANADKSGAHKHIHSHDYSHSHDNHDDNVQLTDRQANISQTKADTILSVLSDSTDFLDFEKRLQSLILPDAGITNELATQNLQSYIDGVAGATNEQGEQRG